MAADHLEQHHAERPEVGVRAHLVRDQPLRRSVRDGAGDVRAKLTALFERLGNAEVEHPPVTIRRNHQVRRLEIGMDDPVGLPVDDTRERMRPFHELAQPRRVAGGIVSREPSLPEQGFERLPFDELHRDVEVIAIGAEVVDDRHHPMRLRKPLLEDRALAFSLDPFRTPFAVVQHEFQRDWAVVGNAGGGKDGPERTATDRFGSSDLEIFATHQRGTVRERRGAGTGVGGRTMLDASTSTRRAALSPVTISGSNPANTLPAMVRRDDGPAEIGASLPRIAAHEDVVHQARLRIVRDRDDRTRNTEASSLRGNRRAWGQGDGMSERAGHLDQFESERRSGIESDRNPAGFVRRGQDAHARHPRVDRSGRHE